MHKQALRVLIIDDSDDDARLIGRALHRAGFEIDWVRVDTGSEIAAALADERGWDVVVCDYLMPKLDATHALDAVHRAIPAVPVVLVCGAYPHHLWHELGSGLARRFVCKDRLAQLPDALRALLTPPDDR